MDIDHRQGARFICIFVIRQDLESPADLDLLVLQAKFQSEVLSLCETVAGLVRARHDTIAKVNNIRQQTNVQMNSLHSKVKASADYLDSIWLR